jgi:membrane protease subunit HflK
MHFDFGQLGQDFRHILDLPATVAQPAPEASVAPSTVRPSAPLSSEAPPQMESTPKVGGSTYSSSSRDGALRSRDREGR